MAAKSHLAVITKAGFPMRHSRTSPYDQPKVPTSPGGALVNLGSALVAIGAEMRRARALLRASESWGKVAPQESMVETTGDAACSLPAEGHVRIWDILGRSAVKGRPATRAVIPVSRATWYAGIRAGRFPKPVKAGGIALWRVEDIRVLVGQLGEDASGRSNPHR